MCSLRPLIGALLILSACTPDAPETAAAPGDPARPPADSSDTKAARATAAGLSDEYVAYLDSTGVPVYLPVLPAGWQVEDVFTERDNENDTFVPFYSATYRTPDSTCVYISGSEGPGEPFATAPPDERTVTVVGVPTDGPVRLGWDAAGEDSGNWAGGLVATEPFGGDGHSYVAGTSDEQGCEAASHEDVETLLAALRALDPADDVAVD